MEKIHPLAIPALVLAAIFGGVAPVFAKFALKEFDPISIVAIRFISAFFILLPILIYKKQFKIPKKDILKVSFAGLLFAGNVFFFILGLQFTTAIASQLLYLLVPLITLWLSKIFFGEKFSFWQILGTIIGIFGGSIILGKSLTAKELIYSLGSFKGNIIILLGSFSWSGYLIWSKTLNKKYSPLTLTTFSAFVTALISLPFLAKEASYGLVPISGPTQTGVISLLALIFLNSIGCFFLYQWGTKYSSAFTAASVIYISPLAGMVVAIPVLGERLTLSIIISAAFIFLSLFFATIQPLLLKKKKG